jgi:hypothetical protein
MEAANDQSSTRSSSSTMNQLDPVFLVNQGPSRMEISATERTRALRIKAAIEEAHGLDPLTDFEYAQLALVDGDNVDKSLQRAHHFQIFREEYGFRDTFEENRDSLRWFVENEPGMILSLSYHEEEKNYVIVFDLAKFDQSAIKNPSDERHYMGACYAAAHAICPDLYSIRKGAFMIIECDGYDWKRCSVKTRRRAWTEVFSVYPCFFQHIKYFNTGVIANLAVSLLKRFLPGHIYDKIQVGCQYPLGRLDAFYTLPSKEAAKQRLFERIDLCLRTRFDNQKNFRLTTPTDPPANMATANQASELVAARG